MNTTILTALALLNTASAEDHSYPTFGQSVASNIGVNGEEDNYAFTAAPGQGVMLQVTQTSNRNNQDWLIIDRWDRIVASNTNQLTTSGPVYLMGGDYTLRITGDTGTYTFTLWDVPTTESTVTEGVPFSGNVATPDARVWHHFNIPTDSIVFFDEIANSGGGNLSWTIYDAAGQVVVNNISRISDSGRVPMKAGDYTLETTSEIDRTGSYTYVYNYVVDQSFNTTIGSTISDAIDHPGQRDTWSFPAVAGTCISFDFLSSTNTNGLAWYLEDPDGNRVGENGSSLSDGGPYCLLDGTYTLRIQGEVTGDDNTGTYEVHIIDVVDINDTLNVGDPVSDAITAPGHYGHYTFTATAGQRLVLDDLGSSNANSINWSLDHIDGRPVARWSSNTQWHAPIALTAGQHVLHIRGENNYQGTYSYRLVEPTVTNVATTIGSQLVGTQLDSGDATIYSFTATPGQGIDLDLISSSSSSELNYILRDSVGRVVYGRTSSIVDTGPIYLVGGDYTLEIVGENDRVHDWVVDLNDAGVSTWSSSGTPLTLNSPYFALPIAAGATQDYEFTLTGDEQLYFDAYSGDRDLDWTLIDSAGRALFFGEIRYNFQDIETIDVKAGDYTLRFINTDTVAHDAGFEVITVGNSSSLYTIGDVASGTASTIGATVSYTFDVPTTRSLYFDYQGGSDQDWTLTDPVGTSVFSSEARFDWQDQGPVLVTPGTWTLAFTGDGDELSSHTFQIAEPQPMSEVVAIGDVVSDASAVQGDVYTYYFDAIGDERIFLDVVNGFDGNWRIYDPAGQKIYDTGADFDWQDVGPFDLTTGTWRIEVDPDDHEIEDWIFEIVDVTDRDLPLTLDTVYSDTHLSGGDVDTYTFSLAEATTLYFEALAGNSDVNWRLRDTVGRQYWSAGSMFSGTNDIGPFNLLPGDYELVIAPEDGETPTYGFNVHTTLHQSFVAPYNTPIADAIATAGARYQHHFTIVDDGRQVYFDLLDGSSDLNWALYDEVGERVFGHSTAQDITGADRGIYRLAAGDYYVEFTGDDADLPPYEHRVLADIESREFYYTRNNGSTTLKSQQYVYDGSLTTALRFDVANIPRADGIILTPAGDLVIGGRNDGVYVTDGVNDSWSLLNHNGGSANHPSLDPSGNVVWMGGEPDTLSEMPAAPMSDGLPIPITGDDPVVTHLMWDRDGTAWYARSGSNGLGNFGQIDMATKTTTRHLGPDFPVHTMTWDIFTETLFLVGSDTISQWDTDTMSVIHQLQIPGEQFDGFTVDGQGRALLISSTGYLWVVDYTASGAVDDPTTTVHSSYLDENVDSISPLSWLGSGCLGLHAIATMDPPEGSDVPIGPRLIRGSVLTPTPTRPVSNVMIGGVPAVGPDAAGQFWAVVDVQLGAQALDVDIIDRCGTQTVAYNINGVDGNQASQVTDLTQLAVLDMHGTTWGSDGTTLVTDVDTTNDSAYAWRGPLWLAVGPDLAPQIQLRSPDGVTDDGLPYKLLADETAYIPGGSTVPQFTWVFDNPGRFKPGFTPRLYGPINNPPVFMSPPTLVLNEGEAWTYLPDVFDPDGDPITFELLRGPSGVSINPSTGQLDWLPTVADGGLHAFELRADDGRAGTTTQSWVLYVGSGFTNRAPVFTTLPNVEGDLGEVYVYDSHAVDLDGNGIVYSVVMGPPGMTIGLLDGIVHWPSPVTGLHDVEISADDGQGGVSSQSYQVSIGAPPPNQAPVITSTPKDTISKHRRYIYAARGVDPDREPGDPALVWRIATGPAGLTIDQNGRLNWLPTDADVGTHTVTIEVGDYEGGVGEQTYQLVVDEGPPNLPPIFETAPSDKGILGTAWRYAPYAEDPEAGMVTYNFVSGPTGMTWNADQRLLIWDVADLMGGTHAVVFTAEDPDGNVTTQAWDLFIRTTNDPPGFDPISAPDGVAGAAWQFDVDAIDPDDDELTYSIISGPANMTIDRLTGLMFWVPQSGDVGTTTVTLRATDEYDAYQEVTFSFDVGLDTVPPQAVLDITTDNCVGGVTTICVLASDDIGLASRSLTINGSVEPLDTFSCATVTVNIPSTLNLTATAIDVGNNVATDTDSVTLSTCP